MKKIEINVNDYNYSKCYNSSDFYKAVDLFRYFESKEITDVRQMMCNTFTFEYVLGILKSNSKKNKQLKYLKKEKREQAVSFDWHNYSPMIDDNLDDYIIICDLKDVNL